MPAQTHLHWRFMLCCYYVSICGATSHLLSWQNATTVAATRSDNISNNRSSKSINLTSTTTNVQNISSTTTPGSVAIPAKMLFLGYQHNYYNYDEPLIPSAKKDRPLIDNLSDYAFLSDTLANLKVDSSFKTAKSAANNRKPHLSFAGFGNHLPVQSPAVTDQMEMAGTQNVKDTLRFFSAEFNGSTSKPATPSLTEKVDSLHGISTGNSYTPACVKSQLQTICLDDPFYPTDSVKEAVSQNQQDFAKLYAEVAFQSADNLCDGLNRVDEEKYCNVFSQIHPISSVNSWTANMAHSTPSDGSAGFDSLRARVTTSAKPQAGQESSPTRSNSNSPFSLQGRGYICQSVIHYARALRAKNHRGRWRIVVNIPGYSQTSRFEECTRPLQRCQWNYQRLLVWDKYNGFEMDIFRLPVSCSCFIRPRVSPSQNVLNNQYPVAKSVLPSGLPTNQMIDTALKRPTEEAPTRSPSKPTISQERTPNDQMLMQTSETIKRYSYMPPDGPPVDPYLYHHYLTNLLPIQSVRYMLPGTVQVETTEYGDNWRLRKSYK